VKVFVLEDDGDVRAAVVRFLEAAGYAVDAAATWIDAHEHLSVNDYDALVLDRSVPGGDSLDLLTDRRHDGDRTPALFLTARDAITDRVDGLAAGADDYLVKPFAMEELVARVHVLTRRSVVPTMPVLALADLAVDQTGLTASRAGASLGLTIKEFSILRYLVVNAGRIVSRTELIEHCWNEFIEPMSNVVDVKVAQLRKKLGEPALVHTVRGAGYVAAERAP
jgi:two-component system copper resistance phosphate regulon response regulator CusR